MWHCPHCGAPQAETARCWVCHRSSTTCSTCRNFRTSLAADLGYCGRDRTRAPLTGLELRPCWEEGARSRAAAVAATNPAAEPDGTGPARRPLTFVRGDGGPLDRPDPMRLRGFVPVDELLRSTSTASAPEAATPDAAPPDAAPPLPPAALADPPDRWEGRTSLFGEPDR